MLGCILYIATGGGGWLVHGHRTGNSLCAHNLLGGGIKLNITGGADGPSAAVSAILPPLS
jgi:hypothetical protein